MKDPDVTVHRVPPGLYTNNLIFPDVPIVALCGRVFQPQIIIAHQGGMKKVSGLHPCEKCDTRLNILEQIDDELGFTEAPHA